MDIEEQLAKKDSQIQRLKEKLASSKRTNAKLKKRIAELELELSGDMPNVQNRHERNAVKSFIVEHRALWNSLQELCKSWRLRTRNTTQTLSAITAIFTPDIFGVVEYSENDVLNYLTILKRMGIRRYIQVLQRNRSYDYYKPTDTLVLFKNFKNIRDILIKEANPEQSAKERTGISYVYATYNGVKTEDRTMPCTLNDLKSQKLNEPHPNDDVSLDEFKGDDKIREYMRREAQKTGYIDFELLKTRMQKAYDKKFGDDFTEPPKQDIIVLQSTSILDEDDEDDDITLNDFQEVK